MPWVIVSVMPHQPIVWIPTTFSISGNRTAGPQNRYECFAGTSEAMSAFTQNGISEHHVTWFRTETSQKREAENFGWRTIVPPAHNVDSIE